MEYELKLKEKHVIIILQALGRQPFDAVVETVTEIQAQVTSIQKTNGKKPMAK